jgi:glutaconate CoA-transferase subunit B
VSGLPEIDGVRLDTFMACVMSREIENGEWASSGASVPLASAALFLALENHAPDVDVWIQGCVSPSNHNLTDILLSPERLHESAKVHMSQYEIINFSLRGNSGFQYLRPLQIDAHGNVNVSRIERSGGKDLRFQGIAVGDAINAVRRVCFYVTEHSPRTFAESLSFRTGTGHDEGTNWRPEDGLHEAGPVAAVTPLAVLGFDAERRFNVRSVHRGFSLEQVQGATGFGIEPAPDCGETPMPDASELAALERVDPDELRLLEFRETRAATLEFIAERQRESD